MLTEDANGSVLFQFKPTSQAASEKAVVTYWKQQRLLTKLRQIATGRNVHEQLDFQLWESASIVDGPSSNFALATDSPDAQQSHDRQNGTVADVGDESSTIVLQAGWNGDSLPQQSASSNGGTEPSVSQGSSESYEQPAMAGQDAFANLPDPSDRQLSLHQKPSLLRKPVRPAAPEPRSLTSRHDLPSYSGRQDARVPCYLWHESGLPKRVDLRRFATGTYEETDDTVSTADSQSPSADSTSSSSTYQAEQARSARSVHNLLEPVRQCILWLWRLLPYWMRKFMTSSQQRRPPVVHASPIISAHVMAASPFRKVEGSSYNLSTGICQGL